MPNRHKPIGNTDETLQNTYEQTQARLQKIKDAGYKVVSIWVCEFRKLLRLYPGFVNEHPYVKNSPINIPDDLYGGRSKASKTYYRVKERRSSSM